MTEIHKVIATTIAKHDPWDYAGGLECRCSREFRSDTQRLAEDHWAEHVAHEVVTDLIRELLMTKTVYHGEPL